jgi:hypothetical protein
LQKLEDLRTAALGAIFCNYRLNFIGKRSPVDNVALLYNPVGR